MPASLSTDESRDLSKFSCFFLVGCGRKRCTVSNQAHLIWFIVLKDLTCIKKTTKKTCPWSSRNWLGISCERHEWSTATSAAQYVNVKSTQPQPVLAASDQLKNERQRLCYRFTLQAEAVCKVLSLSLDVCCCRKYEMGQCLPIHVLGWAIKNRIDSLWRKNRNVVNLPADM